MADAAANGNFLMLTKHLNDTLLIVKSIRRPGFSFKFMKLDKRNGKIRYKCWRCNEIEHNRVITLDNGVIIGRINFEDGHHANCDPLPDADIAVLKVNREMRLDVKRTGKRPRDAYEEAHSSIAVNFSDHATQQDMRVKFPRYNSFARQLYRFRDNSHIRVPDVNNIPNDLRVTWRGLHAPIDDPYYQEPFLLYEGQNGRLLIFCCLTELKVLHESKYASGDGTFEFAPDTSMQLYTIFGWKVVPNFPNSEGLPLIWALLPNKTQATYVEMFTAVNDALIREFGSVGSLEYIITDFEIAAINAIEQVFPNIVCRGCVFHFRQAILRKVNEIGLKKVYVDENPPEIKGWIKKIMGLTLLPLPQIPTGWQVIQQPPIVGDIFMQQKLHLIRDYFEATWLNGSFPPTLWNHFNHPSNEPRTTNANEGYHNSLNHIFVRSHPSLQTFLNWLQKYQFEIQTTVLQLNFGTAAKSSQ